jgi:hypothetical protein
MHNTRDGSRMSLRARTRSRQAGHTLRYRRRHTDLQRDLGLEGSVAQLTKEIYISIDKYEYDIIYIYIYIYILCGYRPPDTQQKTQTPATSAAYANASFTCRGPAPRTCATSQKCVLSRISTENRAPAGSVYVPFVEKSSSNSPSNRRPSVQVKVPANI